jgi:hypothetical protein
MLYNILKDFKGSQDGRFAEEFKAGTQAELSDYLAGCIDPAWAKLANAPEAKAVDGDEIKNKAVPTTGKQGGMVRNKVKQ